MKVASFVQRPQWFTRMLTLVAAVCIAALSVFTPADTRVAHAASFTVTNINDGGAGSLRQAITDANGTTALDEIAFNIPGGGVKTITLASALPNIIFPVVIDGLTQPNASCAAWPPTLLIELNGGGNGTGLNLGSQASGSTVRGLVINRFGIGIQIANSNNNRVECNFIGTNAAGTATLPNTTAGVYIQQTASGNTVGGPANTQRNLIAGSPAPLNVINFGAKPTNTNIQNNYIGTNAAGTARLDGGDSQAVYIFGADNTRVVGNVIVGSGNGIAVSADASRTTNGTIIQGNRIGTDAAGIAALGNAGDGIRVAPTGGATTVINTAIGGPGDNQGNTVSGNSGAGIFVAATNTTIQANFIGTSAGDTGALGNTGAGIAVGAGSTGTRIGGTQIEERNVIANNGGSGVSVQSATGVAIRGNAISNNGGDGITLASGANNNQRAPTITSVANNVQGWMIGAPNTTYAIDLFLNRSCDPSGVGQGETPFFSLPTTTGGNGASAINANVGELPGGRFVTATATDPAGNTSIFSSCAPVGPDNTAWYTPLDLAPAPTANVDQYLALPGQTRWYRFAVNPRSRVTVNLSNLPGDYDVALFSDIAGEVGDLTNPPPGLQILATQQAQLDYDALEASNFVTNTLDPQYISPEAYTAEALSPGTFRPSVLAPYAVSPFMTSPFMTSPFMTSPFMTSPFMTSPFMTSPFMTSPFMTSPFMTSPLNAAEREVGVAVNNSLLSVTALNGTTSRSLVLNTWDTGGSYYVAVYGQNGSYNPARPFSLTVTANDTACSAVTAPAPNGALLPGVGGNYRTIILADPSRLVGSAAEKDALRQRLASFAARSEVSGVVVDVGQDGLVRAANTQADNLSACPNAKNIVAEAVKGVVTRYRTANPNLAYVVIVGGDATIPFFRYPDQALLGNEATFAPPVRPPSASQASLRLGYILGQDAYGTSLDVPFKSTVLPVPQLAVGRLVETAAEATTMLDAYIATGGVITPTTSLVSGYDFHYDSSQAISREFGRGTGRTVDELLSPSTQSHQQPGTWTADDLRDRLFGSRHDLLYLAGHFSDGGLLAADYATSLEASELAQSTTPLTGALVISPGCHVGYNTVDGDAVGGVTTQPDWAQAFARKGAALIGGTGYQYGDTQFVQFAEELYVYVAQQLRVGSGPVAVGQALAAAKQRYLTQSTQLRGIDQKTLAVATLYGLPMMRVNMPGERLTLPADTSIVALRDLVAVSNNPYDLRAADVTITPTLTEQTISLTPTTGGTARPATYLFGTNGVVANPAEPVQPLEQRDVSVNGTLLRGVGFLGGNYTDLADRLPLTGAPATELRGVHVTFPTEAFYPHKFWNANYFGKILDPATGVTNLNVTPSQFLANGSNSDTGTIRQYGPTQYRLFYNNNTARLSSGVIPALAGPPTIVRVTSSAAGNMVTFSVGAFGEQTVGVQQVWVTYTGTSGQLYGQWQSLDLARSPNDDLLWQGTLMLPAGTTSGALRFMVQAANQVGLVTLDTNGGTYYAVGNDPGVVAPPSPRTATLALNVQPATVGYNSSVTIQATLTTGSAALSGQTINISVDTLTRQAVTNSSGVATVSLPLEIDPGQYTVNATFAGSSSYREALTTAPLTVRKQNSTLALSPSFANVGTGATDTLVATLTAAGQPIVGETVVLIVSGNDVSYSNVVKTDIAGRAPLGVIPLPAGSYTVSAYFGGDIPAPVSASYTSGRYNNAAPQSSTLTISAAPDTVLPQTSIGSVPPDPSNNASATFTFSARDNLTPVGSLTFECRLDNSTYAACTSPKNYGRVANGAHIFEVRAVDAAGNRDGTPAFHRWSVNAPAPTDTTAPDATPTFQPPANGAGWNNTDVTVTWNWTDNSGGAGIDIANCTASSVSSGEGTLTLNASCSDVAGNVGTATRTVKVDKTAPATTGSVTSTPNQATVTLSANDALSGVAATSYRVNNGAPQTYSAPFQITGVGTYAVTFASTDRAGNVEMSRTLNLTIGNFPANGTLDTFNRKNGALGSTWGGLTNTDFYKIANQRVDVGRGGPIYWKANFGTNQEAFVTFSTIDSASREQGLLLKAQTSSLPQAGTIAVVYDAPNRTVRVQTYRPGLKEWKRYANQPITFANGDRLVARALANGDVLVYKNTTLVATVRLDNADQTFFNPKGGAIGVWFTNAKNAFFDDFGGGTLAP